jgi:hypothetical protein
MRAVFVCAAGCNRSHALNLNAKLMWGWDSVALGYANNTSLFSLVAPWADRIVLVEKWDPWFIPAGERHKIAILEMGPDRWGHVGHPEMHALARTLLKMWEAHGWKAGLVVYNTLPLP